MNLKYYDEKKLKRAKIDSIYRHELEGISELGFLSISPQTDHNYAYFPIIVKENNKYTRDELYEFLREKGIMVRRYFYPLILL